MLHTTVIATLNCLLIDGCRAHTISKGMFLASEFIFMSQITMSEASNSFARKSLKSLPTIS